MKREEEKIRKCCGYVPTLWGKVGDKWEYVCQVCGKKQYEGEVGGASHNKAEKKRVTNILENAHRDLRTAFWSSRSSLQVLQETEHADIEKKLKGAEEAINKAISVYERVIREVEGNE